MLCNFVKSGGNAKPIDSLDRLAMKLVHLGLSSHAF